MDEYKPAKGRTFYSDNSFNQGFMGQFLLNGSTNKAQILPIMYAVLFVHRVKISLTRVYWLMRYAWCIQFQSFYDIWQCQHAGDCAKKPLNVQNISFLI